MTMQQDRQAGKGTEHVFLRDHLAVHRTTLANERTFLAYIRTALALFVAGVSLIKFFGSPLTEILGWVLVPLGMLTLARGIASFRKTRREIEKEGE